MHVAPLPSDRSLWIVIPALDAQATLAGVIAGVKEAAQGVPILVVDDGSKDETERVAREAGALVLRHPENRGKGAALQTGFAHALGQGAKAVLTLDADGQHDPVEIAALRAAHLGQREALVIGVRSFDPRLMPRRSRIGNTISTFFISHFAGRTHKDSQSGFRIYPRSLLLSAPLKTSRFDTETELLLWASKMGVPLLEVPIQTIYHRHGHRHGHGHGPEAQEGPVHVTHFRTFSDTIRVLRLVVGSLLWPDIHPKQEEPSPSKMEAI